MTGFLPQPCGRWAAGFSSQYAFHCSKVTGNFDNVNVKNDEHVVIGGKTFHFLEVSDQVLNGEQTLTLLDKNFLTSREFKKVSHATKMECLQTGKEQNTRIYHVTI